LFRFFEFLVTADVARPTEIIALEAAVAALLCLHGIIACKEQSVQTKKDFFVVLTIPHADAGFRRLTETKR
jgi:hypothetical protein